MLEIEHRAMEEIEQQARVWLSHRPGLFERPSENECRQAMLADFRKAYPEGDHNDDLFWTLLKVAGFEVRATPTGGYILDWS